MGKKNLPDIYIYIHTSDNNNKLLAVIIYDNNETESLKEATECITCLVMLTTLCIIATIVL